MHYPCRIAQPTCGITGLYLNQPMELRDLCGVSWGITQTTNGITGYSGWGHCTDPNQRVELRVSCFLRAAPPSPGSTIQWDYEPGRTSTSLVKPARAIIYNCSNRMPQSGPWSRLRCSRALSLSVWPASIGACPDLPRAC